MTLRFVIAALGLTLAITVVHAQALGDRSGASLVPIVSEFRDPAIGETASMASPKTALDKFSGNVRFLGSVGHAFHNLEQSARIAFTKLQNQHATRTTEDLTVFLFLTTTPVADGDTFSAWFVGKWDAPSKLAPGESFQNVDVTVPWLFQPPDGIYYVNLGSYEIGPGCGNGVEYCYDDLRQFPNRVQFHQGGYYAYTGPPEPGAQSAAVEFFHAGMGHYFVSADDDEIANLDLGVYTGWVRTGQTFNVWTSGSGLADVCRFFTTSFAAGSSHFYTANAVECESLKVGQVWQYEKLAFKVALPAGGRCAIGVPLYRLYNDGRTGAPNHRVTTSFAIRSDMIDQGFVPEDGSTVCVASRGGP